MFNYYQLLEEHLSSRLKRLQEECDDETIKSIDKVNKWLEFHRYKGMKEMFERLKRNKCLKEDELC